MAVMDPDPDPILQHLHLTQEENLTVADYPLAVRPTVRYKFMDISTIGFQQYSQRFLLMYVVDFDICIWCLFTVVRNVVKTAQIRVPQPLHTTAPPTP